MSVDFLTDDFDVATPELTVADYPYFQVHGDAEVFEFPAIRTNDQGETPLWSAIIGDALPSTNLKHGTIKTKAYAFPTIDMAILGSLTWWEDKRPAEAPGKRLRGRFANMPPKSLQQQVGATFKSKTVVVGIVKQIEDVAPQTLCYLTVSGMASKYVVDMLVDYRKQVLMAAYGFKEAQLEAQAKKAGQKHQKSQRMHHAEWMFWAQLKFGNLVQVSDNKSIPPVVGNWPSCSEITPQYLAAQYLPKSHPDLKDAILSTLLPEVGRWLTAKSDTIRPKPTTLEALMDADVEATITPLPDEPPMPDDMPEDDIPF